jgi:hypothetical protein
MISNPLLGYLTLFSFYVVVCAAFMGNPFATKIIGLKQYHGFVPLAMQENSDGSFTDNSDVKEVRKAQAFYANVNNNLDHKTNRCLKSY